MFKAKYLKFSHLFFVTNLGGTSIFDMRDYVQSNRLRSDRVFKTSSDSTDSKEVSNKLAHQR